MPSSSESPRNIVFFGETGTGKSSTINLLLEAGTSASVSNDNHPCTQVATSYETTLNGVEYILWDTPGLTKGSGFLRNMFRFATSSEKELRNFLKERHQKHEIDLLVYCVQGFKSPKALMGYYNDFCLITRQLAAPAVLLVTHLEQEPNMEEWWNRNAPSLERLNVEFDGHACITALPGHSRTAESKERLVDLVTKKRLWQVQRNGSYFGSPVRMSIPSASPPREGLLRGLSKGGARNHDPSNSSGPSSTAPSDPVEIETQVGPSGAETSGTSSSQDDLLLTPPHGHSSTALDAGVPLRWYTNDSEKSSSPLIIRRKNYTYRHGSFGDIWKCDLVSGKSSRLVAVKVVASQDYMGPYEKFFYRNLRVLRSLRHRNIVPLLGIEYSLGSFPSMVIPWFNNGSLSHYLDRHLSLSGKHSLLRDIADGLSYLHSENIIHGDMHSDNVLIDDDGRACLTDCVLSSATLFAGTSYWTSDMCSALRFADPALVQQVYPGSHYTRLVSRSTKPCDVYSFGGLLLHVMSEKKPYDGISHADVLQKVLKGERPEIPMHDQQVALHESLIQRCWDHDEDKRPPANNLAAMLYHVNLPS